MAKTWLITGSSRGLGRELAQAAADSGDNVAAAARHPGSLDDLVARYGGRILPVALDVTDPVAAREAVQAAVTEFGSLDVVVNNAGYATSASIEDLPEEEFAAQLDTNLFGVVNVTRAALPVLRAQRSGHIIQVSSIGGRVGGTPGMGGYQTAKYAVEGFSEVLSNEVRPLGIKVTIVEPGAFRTDWGGSSMRILPVSEDYEPTVGEMNRYRRAVDGQQPGDPARAAEIITQIARLGQPPLRLLLGSDALRIAGESARAREAEAAEWAPVSRSADFGAAPLPAGYPRRQAGAGR
jgi:NAD(P)-dependent dehydrogenase (short-subunit alcohol dehydrogenase family)